jgi:hypothetical protein
MELLYIGVLLGRTDGWRLLVISLRRRENVLLISRAVEITPHLGCTCSYECVETRSSHIHLGIVGEPYTNGLDEH